MSPLLQGLLIGSLFGAILSLTGLSSPLRILDMLRLRDFSLMKLLAVAIGTGMVGIALLGSAGLGHTSIKPLHLIAVLLGGGIFGAGFALAGYCPGTALAGAAEGRRDAFLAVAGGLAGSAVFAALYARLAPLLVEPLTFGKPTVFSWLSVPALSIALPIAGLIAWSAWRWWRTEHPDAREPAPRERSAY